MDNDKDKEYLLDGVTNGFNIIDDVDKLISYECENYKSAENPDAKPKLDKLLKQEIASGKISQVQDKPQCIHSYGAVPKKGTDELRPVTDCSRPFGVSINEHIEYKRMRYMSIDDAAKHIRPGSYFAIVDISKAYRSVPINPKHRKYQGLKWMFGTYDRSKYKWFQDNFLCFGCSSSPGIFTRISDAIRRIMLKKGYTVINFIDDFLIIADSYDECLKGQLQLISLLIELGFAISWHKVIGPTCIIVFLGLTLNSIDMCVSMPGDKVIELKELLSNYLEKKKATKREIQCLAGKLSFASTVIKAGRSFSRRVIDLLKTVKRGHHFIKLNNAFRKDVRMWLSFLLDNFNGTAKLLDNLPVDLDIFQTDSSFFGYGAYFDGEWLAGGWHDNATPCVPANVDISKNWCNFEIPDAIKGNINALEFLPIVKAARTWGHLWSNKKVIVYTDNMQCLSYINKGTCKDSPPLMDYIRELSLIAAINNFQMVAHHIKGEQNVIADCLSRLDNMRMWDNLIKYIAKNNIPFYLQVI